MQTADQIDAEYENDDIYNAAIPDMTDIEAERMYAKIGLDYETGLPVETAAMKFADEAQDEIDYKKLCNLLAATIELDNTYRARDNATREFTRHCMEENIVYFGKQVMQYA